MARRLSNFFGRRLENLGISIRIVESWQTGAKRVQDKELQERLKRQDVQLLLTQLLKNEEAMVKLILERLYDTGTGNWIDRQVRFRPVKPGLRLAARCAKPAGRYLGYKWMVKNTPKLITRWLFSQVAFRPKKVKPVKAQPVPSELLA
ncbi:MAG: hypothetical protein AAGB01_11700, partial [Cyanobacteria bacterium P01_F01_bin.42]